MIYLPETLCAWCLLSKASHQQKREREIVKDGPAVSLPSDDRKEIHTMNYKDNTAAKNSESMKKLTFTDDWMFGMVMQDKEICKELLERILPEEKFSRIQLAGADGTSNRIKTRNKASSQPYPIRSRPPSNSTRITTASVLTPTSKAKTPGPRSKCRSTPETIWGSAPAITVPTWTWTCSWPGRTTGI